MYGLSESFLFDGNYTQFQLANGMAVALLRAPTNTISGTLNVEVGSAHEQEGEEGLFHLLEHAIFKGGSAHFPPELAGEVIPTFGYFNAATDVNRTSYQIGILPEKLELFLQFISDLVFLPSFDPVRVERKRIMREIADDYSRPEFIDNQNYNRALFDGHPFALDVAGKRPVLNKATISDLVRIHSQSYHANNMTLILAGPLPPQTEGLIQTYFDCMPAGDNRKKELPSVRPLEERVILHREASDLVDNDSPEESSARVSLGILVPPYNSPDSHKVKMLAHALVSFTESRLFRIISDHEGLAYSIDGEYDGLYNKGLLEIRSPVYALKLKQAIDIMFREMRRLQETPIDDKELTALKDNILYKMASKLERSRHLVQAVEQYLDFGVAPINEVERMQSVTSEDIVKAATAYLPRRINDGRYVMLVRDPFYTKNSPIS